MLYNSNEYRSTSPFAHRKSKQSRDCKSKSVNITRVWRRYVSFFAGRFNFRNDSEIAKLSAQFVAGISYVWVLLKTPTERLIPSQMRNVWNCRTTERDPRSTHKRVKTTLYYYAAHGACTASERTIMDGDLDRSRHRDLLLGALLARG